MKHNYQIESNHPKIQVNVTIIMMEIMI